ncbi:MAG: hemerythrin domain-containing protein [Ahrensia sp.]
MSQPIADTALGKRNALPDDLTFLLSRYPRSDWQNHKNLGDMAQFWLKRHDMFRDLGGQLVTAVSDYREERANAQAFAAFFVPRLRFFLQQLNGHHHIEDTHYFPVFAAAEKKLSRGFDLLDADHHVIHDALEANAAAANRMLQTLSNQSVDPRSATDDYANNADTLIALLTRHLHDEEDLIIPLILDRTEAALGI